jgi:hypothetical protein
MVTASVDGFTCLVSASTLHEVILQVTSDIDDEIHAHTGGRGYELEVKADEPSIGTFTARSGQVEVESHRLEKTIVILMAAPNGEAANVRLIGW